VDPKDAWRGQADAHLKAIEQNTRELDQRHSQLDERSKDMMERLRRLERNGLTPLPPPPVSAPALKPDFGPDKRTDVPMRDPLLQRLPPPPPGALPSSSPPLGVPGAGQSLLPTSGIVSVVLNEPWEVMAISCPDEAPLLSFVSLVAPAIALGNRVVVTPSPRQPLPALDLYQVLDTSDVPGGVVNIVTGDRDQLAAVLAKHDDVAAHWYFGSKEGCEIVEKESAGNLKPVWTSQGLARDWHDPAQGQGEEFLFHAVRHKAIWTPFGV